MSNNLRIYNPIPPTEEERGFRGPEPMSVTAFVAGKYGNGVQFTIGHRYCCLSGFQVRDLIYALQQRIDCADGYRATCSDLDETVEPVAESLP